VFFYKYFTAKKRKELVRLAISDKRKPKDHESASVTSEGRSQIESDLHPQNESEAESDEQEAEIWKVSGRIKTSYLYKRC
jgi:hypothetical protein